MVRGFITSARATTASILTVGPTVSSRDGADPTELGDPHFSAGVRACGPQARYVPTVVQPSSHAHACGL